MLQNMIHIYTVQIIRHDVQAFVFSMHEVHDGYSGVFSLQTPSEYCIVLVSIMGIYLVSILWV